MVPFVLCTAVCQGNHLCSLILSQVNLVHGSGTAAIDNGGAQAVVAISDLLYLTHYQYLSLNHLHPFLSCYPSPVPCISISSFVTPFFRGWTPVGMCIGQHTQFSDAPECPAHLEPGKRCRCPSPSCPETKETMPSFGTWSATL